MLDRWRASALALTLGFACSDDGTPADGGDETTSAAPDTTTGDDDDDDDTATGDDDDDDDTTGDDDDDDDDTTGDDDDDDDDDDDTTTGEQATDCEMTCEHLADCPGTQDSCLFTCSLLPAYAAVDTACGESQQEYFECRFSPECDEAGSNAEAACGAVEVETATTCLDAAPDVCVDLCQAFVDCTPDPKDLPEPCTFACIADLGWSEVEGPAGCVQAWEDYGACVDAEGCDAFGKVLCEEEDAAVADCSPFE